jgi:hypothetical protein
VAIVTCDFLLSDLSGLARAARPDFFAPDSGAEASVCRLRVTPRLTAFVEAASLPRLPDLVRVTAAVFFGAALESLTFAVTFFRSTAFFTAALLPPFRFPAVLPAAVFFAAALRGFETRPAVGFSAARFARAVPRAVVLARAVVPRPSRGLPVRRSVGFFGAALPLEFLGLAARGSAESFD